MAQIVILVEFKLHEGKAAEFRREIERHAALSLAEPGCLQFDVVTDGSDPDRILLYEVWADRAAFDAHQAQPRLGPFRDRVGPLVASRSLQELTREPRSAKGRKGKVLVAVAHLNKRLHVLEPLHEAGYEVVLNPYGRTMTGAELIEHLPGCVATLAGMEPYNDETLKAADRLRCIARLGVGYDAIDVDASTRRKVAVAMAFGTNHDAVADHAMALLTACSHKIPGYDRKLRAGGWGSDFHGRLFGTVAGVIGFGRIGRSFSKRCHGFGMEVLVADPVVDPETVARLGCRLVTLDDLLERADYISVHAPYGPGTDRLINAERLARMKKNAILINTARGGLVDEQALIEALQSGRIAGAGLDVFEVEPLPADSKLRDLDNTVLTPHVAGLADWSVEAMARRCVESILDVLQGVNPGDGLILNPEVL